MRTKNLTESGGTLTPTRGGRMLVRIITPGLGSSGFYSEAVLRDAADRKIFPTGTHMYIDHPGVEEQYDRPERTIKDLAGVLAEDAYWDGTGLAAEVKVFEPWATVLTEMHEVIGVSIRATGTVDEGDYEGHPIIASLDNTESVDFVTKPGRGGRVLEILESARTKTTPPDPGGATQVKETSVEITESKYAELTEKATRVDTLEADLTKMQKELDEARDALTAMVKEADTQTVEHILANAGVEFSKWETAGLKADLPLTEAGRLDRDAFKARVTEAATEHATSEGAGTPKGVGTTITESDDISHDELLRGLGIKIKETR